MKFTESAACVVMSVLAVERRVGGGMAVGLFRKLFECQTKPQQGSCPSRALEGSPNTSNSHGQFAACLFGDCLLRVTRWSFHDQFIGARS